MKKALSILATTSVLGTLLTGALTTASAASTVHVALVVDASFQANSDNTGGTEHISYVDLTYDPANYAIVAQQPAATLDFPITVDSVPADWNADNAAGPLQYAYKNGELHFLTDRLVNHNFSGMFFENTFIQSMTSGNVSPNVFGYTKWVTNPSSALDPANFLKQTSKFIVLNNKEIAAVPGVVHNDTMYMPIWYIQKALSSVGVQSTWDGTNWVMTTTKSVDLTNVNAGSGPKTISINGTVVQKVDGIAVNGTMYMPIWYVEQILNRVHVSSEWDGTTWALTSANS